MRSLLVVGYFAMGASARAGTPPGWAHYEQLCAACHGTDGDGRGPAAPYSRGNPRDFTRGAFEWRSTPFGAPPTDDDLRKTLRLGAPGTSMPAFAGVLNDAEIGELIAIVRAFGPPVAAKRPNAIVLGAEPPDNAARGAVLWTQVGCDRCHGADGHGDGPAAATLAEPPYDLVVEPCTGRATATHRLIADAPPRGRSRPG